MNFKLAQSFFTFMQIICASLIMESIFTCMQLKHYCLINPFVLSSYSCIGTSSSKLWSIITLYQGWKNWLDISWADTTFPTSFLFILCQLSHKLWWILRYLYIWRVYGYCVMFLVHTWRKQSWCMYTMCLFE